MTLGPRIPSFVQEIQFITYYLFNPCDVPLTAYFEVSRPIAGEIAIALLQFDFFQFVKTIFKPKWFRSGRHTRRGSRGKKKGGGIPEIADMVADGLDPDGDLKFKRWPAGAGYLIEISEVSERIMWTIFLVEAYESLFVNTIIGVIESDKSHCPNIGRLLRQDDSVLIGGAGGPIRSINIDHREYQHKVSSETGFGASAISGRYAVIWTGTVTAWSEAIEFTPMFRIDTPAGTNYEIGSLFRLDAGQSSSFSLTVTVEGNWGVQWTALVPSYFALLEDMRLFIIQTGD